MLGKTSGKAEVMGIDVFKNISKLRKIMGVCPQQNILFPILTPWEHLSMFSDFKGAPYFKKTQDITKILKDLKLYKKRNSRVGGLSGGMK